MKLIKTPSSQTVVNRLADDLNKALQNDERVLWLLSGGSAVEVAVSAARLLTDANSKNLTVSLVDERFGPVGHPESNWQQLKEAGFDVPGAKLLPVLNGQGFKETAAAWEESMRKEFEVNIYKIALMGIGPDGHTAGILPHSPASSYNGDNLIFAYESEAVPGVRPAFNSITLTNHAITQLDEIVVPAMGDSKRKALENLKRDLPVDEQPAQIIKQVERSFVYNDSIGESEGNS